ncbi:MAG: hypothetical protein ACK4S4_10075 [Pyrinomonadaceae bacterium]
MLKRTAILATLLIGLAAPALAQRPQVTVTLNESFFDALLDAIFRDSAPPEFSIAGSEVPAASEPAASGPNFEPSIAPPACKETIRLRREGSGVRTAARFRDGRIYAPLAFEGNYSPPLVGCVAFSGYAETDLELEFDQAGQRLVARARVLNVALDGTAGLGGSLVARMVQNSIDRKVNPIEVVRLEKLSFLVPIENSPGVRMKAVEVKPEIESGALVIRIFYDFVRG